MSLFITAVAMSFGMGYAALSCMELEKDAENFNSLRKNTTTGHFAD